MLWLNRSQSGTSPSRCRWSIQNAREVTTERAARYCSTVNGHSTGCAATIGSTCLDHSRCAISHSSCNTSCSSVPSSSRRSSVRHSMGTGACSGSTAKYAACGDCSPSVRSHSSTNASGRHQLDPLSSLLSSPPLASGPLLANLSRATV